MRFLRGLSGAVLTFVGTILTLTIATGDYISLGGKKIYVFTSALSPGSAATSITAGSFAITTHATGRGQIFISDGTLWQDYKEVFVAVGIATITTTGAVSAYISAPCTGKLISGKVSFTEALAASDTNYSTFDISNLSNAAAAMLAATAPNTTQVTGGAAIAANTPRALTVHGTAGNLAVTQCDRLKFTSTATGTLANTLTNGQVCLVFARTI